MVTKFLPCGNISQQYSPRSVGSGGSYWSENENDDMIVYKTMTDEGLSPIDRYGHQWEEDSNVSSGGNKSERVRSISNPSSNDGSYIAQSEMPSKPIDSQMTSQDCLTIPKIPISSNEEQSSPSSIQESTTDGEIKSYVKQAQFSPQDCSACSEEDEATGKELNIAEDDKDEDIYTGSESTVANYVQSAQCTTCNQGDWWTSPRLCAMWFVAWKTGCKKCDLFANKQ